MSTGPASRGEEAAAGLTSAEAADRLAKHGPNELPSTTRRNVLRIALDVLSEPMFLLLIAAGVIYLVLGDIGEAVMLMLFANLSIAIAIVQQTRSEKVLDALRDLAVPQAWVVRDGRRRQIAARELVPGDLILVAEGDRVPADAKLLAGEPVQADESLLTGESVPVAKRSAREGDADTGTAGGDDLPWLFSGSLLVRGQARAVVTATGANSAIGRIGVSLGSIQTEPPRLQAQTRRLVRFVGAAGLAMSLLVFTLHALAYGSILDALLAGIAVGMSLLPEEFPLILTVFMVMGAWRISRERVLTRRSAAIESLGAATVLCTDKTGTLTRNHMTVVALVARGEPPSDEPLPATLSPAVQAVLECALLASSRDAIDPMDRAVHELAEHMLPDKDGLLRNAPVRELGVSSDLPATTAAYTTGEPGRLRVTTKGAPEAVTSLCELPEAELRDILQMVERMAARGTRVLAVADCETASEHLPDSPRELRFRFLGLIGFADPVRDGVPAAVAECRRAGVRIVMITGDHPATASAIARDAGIDTQVVLTGAQVNESDETELARLARSCSIYARILPEQKLRIVEALKAAGEVVAMTGDGVNDAPALRAAHIGVAMGGRGTDVAREAASIVLLDDDFRAIPQTIRLGRRIYDNLRKAMGYVVALHVPIAGLAILPLLLGFPMILTPMMIAFLEMIIDPVCSIVFEAEVEEADVMDRPPRDPASALMSPPLFGWYALQGAVTFAIVAGVFVLAVLDGQPEREVRSIVFTCLVVTNLALVLVNRSFRESSVEALSRPNALFWWAIALALGLLAFVLVWTPASELFRLGPIHAHDLAICAGAGATVFLTLQMLKRRWRQRLLS